MSDDDFSVAFHIGPHKTASSHLQQSLLLAADDLADVGVRYYGPEHFRLPGRTIPALFGLRKKRGPGRTKRPANEQLALMRKGAGRLVLSEENYIGDLSFSAAQVRGMRYPKAANSLAVLTAALDCPVDLFLCLRNPASLINSVYSQMLYGQRIASPAQFKALNPLESVNWTEFVARVRAVPGVRQVTVWMYEDYNVLFPKIISALVGDQHAARVPPVAGVIHPGLSSAAVAEILHRHAQGDTVGLADMARRILSVQDGYPPYDGYSVGEHAAADSAYANQVAQIAAMPGVTLLSSAGV